MSAVISRMTPRVIARAEQSEARSNLKYLRLLRRSLRSLLAMTIGGLFVMMTVYAQASFDIISAIDREKLTIGDKVSLTLMAENAKDTEVVFPDKPADPGVFTFVRAVNGKAGKHSITYVFSAFEPGTHILPSVEVKYKKNGETDWNIFNSKRLSVEVASVLKGGEKDIRDIKGLITIPNRMARAFLIIFIVVAVSAIIIFFKTLKNALLPVKKEDPKPPHIVAYEELERLKAMDLPGNGKIKEYYFTVSDIIRHYLENRFSYKAPEMTTEEFLDYAKKAPELKPEERTVLKKFLTSCDMVKFAKYGPTPIEIIDAFRLAEELVDRTKPVVEEEVKV